MDRLVDRTRNSMNALLVLTLVGMWASTSQPISFEELAARIVIDAKTLRDPQAMLFGVEGALAQLEHIDITIDEIRSLQVSTLINLPRLIPSKLVVTDSAGALAGSQSYSLQDELAYVLYDWTPPTNPTDTPGMNGSGRSSDPIKVAVIYELRFDNFGGAYLGATFVGPITDNVKGLVKASKDTVTRIRGFLARLREFHRIVDASGFDPSRTVKEFQYQLSGPVELPFLKKKVGHVQATLFLAAAVLVLLLYMRSLALTMAQTVRRYDDGRDFVFFHSSGLGPVLGTLWIVSAPVMVIRLSLLAGPIVWWALAFGVLGIISAGSIGFTMWGAREKAKKLGAIESRSAEIAI